MLGTPMYYNKSHRFSGGITESASDLDYVWMIKHLVSYHCDKITPSKFTFANDRFVL